MNKKKILIVDDEMDLRMMLEKRFAAEGYSVATAYNGGIALALAKSQPPDIVVLDEVLGDMAGKDVAAKLRENPQTKYVPIIFLSALFSEEQEIEQTGVFDNSIAFAKPFNINELLATVAKLLNKKAEMSVR
jgi:DNA-binding response OmpR family regulator